MLLWQIRALFLCFCCHIFHWRGLNYKRKIMSSNRGTLLCLFLWIIHLGACRKVKVIEESFSIAGNIAGETQNEQVPLHARVDPSPVSGPPHLKWLAGQCFTLGKGSFSYKFCPFHNVTQREHSYRWNAFHGVLGVWKEWIIHNNTFAAMKMENGEQCVGSLFREAKVFFVCGDKTELADVTEPITCQYEVKFKTPAVCPPDALLVYPALSRQSRLRWDEIQRQLHENEITLQGYEKLLKTIFINENLLATTTVVPERHKYKEPSAQYKKQHDHDPGKGFSTLSSCIKEYEKVTEELKQLRSIVNASDFLNKHPEERESVASRVLREIVKHVKGDLNARRSR